MTLIKILRAVCAFPPTEVFAEFLQPVRTHSSSAGRLSSTGRTLSRLLVDEQKGRPIWLQFSLYRKLLDYFYSQNECVVSLKGQFYCSWTYFFLKHTPIWHISQIFIILSCSIAVGTNLSQFICIGRFTAVSFQVLGHMKTILVLIMGFFFFGKEGLNMQVVLGMIIAVIGMIWYGNASSKPGGKERRSHTLPTARQQKHGGLTDSTEHDGKV